jgi:ABC-type nitrate/sulfonate/bicarbonate transport system substrate-binding protein
LKKNNIEYTEDATKKTSENVLLIDTGSEQTAAPAAAMMVKTSVADFAVIPEPAATNLSKAQGLSVRLSLQTLWGEEGYPQAVLLVKKDLTLDGKFVKALLDAISDSATWVKTHQTEAVAAISAHFVKDQSTTLKAPALSETAITNCNIKVEKAKSAKAKIVDYMERINAVGAASFGTPKKDFFLD